MKNNQYLGQVSIAIIDDQDSFVSQILDFFEGLEWKIRVFPEPMKAMRHLVVELPMVILISTHLSTIDGYSVCQFLRSTSCFEKTPIILLTDYKNSSEEEYSKFVSANYLFCKSQSLAQLQSLIESCIKPVSSQNQYRLSA